MFKVRIFLNGHTFVGEFASLDKALYAHADALGLMSSFGGITAIQTLREDGTAIRTTSKSGDWPETPDTEAA